MTSDLKIKKCVVDAKVPHSQHIDAINHASEVLNRYINACEEIGIEPTSIDKVIEEAVEDYVLKINTGISVLDPMPNISKSLFEKFTFHQYISPKDLK